MREPYSEGSNLMNTAVISEHSLSVSGRTPRKQWGVVRLLS
jgi:hypothetical protein